MIFRLWLSYDLLIYRPLAFGLTDPLSRTAPNDLSVPQTGRKGDDTARLAPYQLRSKPLIGEGFFCRLNATVENAII